MLSEMLTIVNFIKACVENVRLSYLLCNEIGSEYKQFLLHTELELAIA